MPSKNKEMRMAYNKAYRLAHRELRNDYSRGYHQAHREEVKARQLAWRQAHRAEEKARGRAFKQVLKAEMLEFLGNKCACLGCGISEPVFLTVDHINGRPKGQRKNAMEEARASGWDKTKFQVLCYNCNCAKRDRGFCPVHQTDLLRRNGHHSSAAQLILREV